MANVSGWNELMNDTNLVKAAYTMFNDAMYGNVIMLMWVAFSSVIYMKTRNIGLTFFLGMLSFSVFYGMLTPLSVTIMTVCLIFELGIAIYQIFWAR